MFKQMITEISMTYTYMINSSENVHNYTSEEKCEFIFGTYDFKRNSLKMGLADISALLIKY
jgi:hypothetical protein